MKGKSVIVTGAASGFGEGLARGFAARGANVVCADMNEGGAAEVARSIRETYGVAAIGTAVNVADETSVEAMVDRAVSEYGALDVMISCAGVLKAGGIEDFEKKDFDFVTSVNYTGFFLCAKYAARAMKGQRAAGREELYDIIQINSKSGLLGSKANFAYAGGKFGGIGLTQSFALELAEYGIKVNAICPGNLLDGPLWSDPEKGLFKQYLDAGKVKDAKTVEDVRRHYESLVPLGRGCRIEDVVRAALYIVEQEYETGQALPVTGGQVMLR
jgi:sorbitol-6-phosphate 2-dehydrogenase